ncbi:MAG TPA: hypothetical protein VJG30_04290 [Candidatus Nanoarchaeia archaeon]|nr:hypothetical protein [Candidatus Nanoarchaeia archaeon]
MVLTIPQLEDDEVFIPTDANAGRIIQLHEFEKNLVTLVNVGQYQAIRSVQAAGWDNAMSLAGDWRTYFYSKEHQDDPKLKAYYESVAKGIKYAARWTRTQVHDLRSEHPFVVNVSRVHSEFDLPLYEEKVIDVSWLPKRDGYIQELDEETGLPREVGSEPNKRFDGTRYWVEYGLSEKRDIVAAIRSRFDSRPFLSLYLVPGLASGGLGVRPEKIFPRKIFRK